MVRTNSATKQVGGSTRSATLREASDMALLTLVINHDDVAWAEMMRRTQPQVRGAIYAILKRYAPVLSSDARADILQDFYVKLLDNDMARLRVYNAARGKLSSWLNLIAYQAAIDHARKIADRPRLVDLDELLAEEAYAPEEHGDVEGKRQLRKYDVIDAHIWWQARQAERKSSR